MIDLTEKYKINRRKLKAMTYLTKINSDYFIEQEIGFHELESYTRYINYKLIHKKEGHVESVICYFPILKKKKC